MDDLVAELETLAREESEQQRLRVRLSHAAAELDTASDRVLQAVERASAEQADVERLESLSATRLLALIKGSREDDLRREQAEAERAAHDLTRARHERDALAEEVRHLRGRVATIGDVRRRREDLRGRVAERAASTGAAGGERLTQLSERIGELVDESREVAEALASARHARQALQEASQVLGSAGSWATYDTFFGGGIIADTVKHDRLEAAQALMRRADASIDQFRRELADVGGGAVGTLDISSGDRIFDVFFDNVISDWQVRGRIKESAGRVEATLRSVEKVTGRLGSRAARIDERRRDLEAERAALVEDTLG